MTSVRPENRPPARAGSGRFLIAVAAWLALPHGASAHPAVEDAEAAAHEDAAAMPQIAFEERIGNFIVRQYQLACLSQFSYLLVSDGAAAVIDPLRDVEVYLKDAEALGAKIRYAILTHSHADFVAGHTELARAAGAEILKSAEGGAGFPHRPMKDGDAIELGSTRLAFWATPGHTLDSTTILASVPGAASDPAYAFTGDTLFIGSIGRPDLIGGDLTAAVLARKAYRSVERLRKLPDGTKILPAHGAGSLCGAHLSDETVSTMGVEKLRNPFLRERSEASFVAEMISKLPVAPAYFSYNAQLNRKGPPIVDRTGELPPALPPARVEALTREGAWVVDVRSRGPYAAGHIPGSVNIAVRGRIGTWAGTIVPHTDPIVLVGTEDEVREAQFRLRRIAYENVVGHLEGGLEAWKAAGLPVRATKSLGPKDLLAAIREGREPMIVDVRSPEEFESLRLGDYANIPLADYRRFGQVLDKTQPVLVVCNSAYRSSLAVGLLERQG
ncbi:MAG: MBL fold metallo-hydrolase, partial [Planctomycetota bacterium]